VLSPAAFISQLLRAAATSAWMTWLVNPTQLLSDLLLAAERASSSSSSSGSWAVDAVFVKELDLASYILPAGLPAAGKLSDRDTGTPAVTHFVLNGMALSFAPTGIRVMVGLGDRAAAAGITGGMFGSSNSGINMLTSGGVGNFGMFGSTNSGINALGGFGNLSTPGSFNLSIWDLGGGYIFSGATATASNNLLAILPHGFAPAGSLQLIGLNASSSMAALGGRRHRQLEASPALHGHSGSNSSSRKSSSRKSYSRRSSSRSFSCHYEEYLEDAGSNEVHKLSPLSIKLCSLNRQARPAARAAEGGSTAGAASRQLRTPSALLEFPSLMQGGAAVLAAGPALAQAAAAAASSKAISGGSGSALGGQSSLGERLSVLGADFVEQQGEVEHMMDVAHQAAAHMTLRNPHMVHRHGHFGAAFSEVFSNPYHGEHSEGRSRRSSGSSQASSQAPAAVQAGTAALAAVSSSDSSSDSSSSSSSSSSSNLAAAPDADGSWSLQEAMERLAAAQPQVENMERIAAELAADAELGRARTEARRTREWMPGLSARVAVVCPFTGHACEVASVS
jgi:hypothetical protein